MKQCEHSDNKSVQRAQTEVNPVWIKAPDDFQNLVRTFAVQRYLCDKISKKIRSAFPEIWATVWENVLSCNVQESFEKILDPDPQVDGFQNLTGFSLCKDTSLVEFLRSSKKRQMPGKT